MTSSHVIAQPQIFSGRRLPFDAAPWQLDATVNPSAGAAGAWSRRKISSPLLHRARILFGRAVAARKDVERLAFTPSASDGGGRLSIGEMLISVPVTFQ